MNVLRCLALAFLLNCVATLAAQEAEPAQDHSLPTPAQIKKLDVHPAVTTLVGSDDSRQLVITGALADRMQDLTGDVTYKVADEGIVRVTSAGRVVPLANGATTITARFGDKAVTAAVTTRAVGENLPINFGNHIVPIFTKLGCNGGGCHGKSGGQNGFALSLLGFVPEFDYQALVKEDRGRRLLLSAPDFSLLLQKSLRLAQMARTRAANVSKLAPMNTTSFAAGSPAAPPSAVRMIPRSPGSLSILNNELFPARIASSSPCWPITPTAR